jgi:hypothetical protein
MQLRRTMSLLTVARRNSGNLPHAVGTGTQPWFGLFARYRDANNHYYVTLRNSNVISLRRLVNGITEVLDSAPFSAMWPRHSPSPL